MRIALIFDYHALASIDMLDKTTAELLVLYELKGRAIEEVYCIEAENYSFSEQQIVKEAKNQMCYNSCHHIYDPRVKYWEMKKGGPWRNAVYIAAIQSPDTRPLRKKLPLQRVYQRPKSTAGRPADQITAIYRGKIQVCLSGK